MFDVLFLTTLNKNEFIEVLNDYGEYADLYNCHIRTNETITEEDFQNKDLIVLGIGDDCVEMISIFEHLKTANLNGTPVGFTHGCPNPNPNLMKETDDNMFEIDTELETKYKEFLNHFGINKCENRDYNFYNEVSITDTTHQIFLEPIPIDTQSNISIIETHDHGIFLNEDVTILLEDPKRPSGRDNFYMAIIDSPEGGQGRIAYSNIGHNYYAHDQFFKPEGYEKHLLVNVCNWLLRL